MRTTLLHLLLIALAIAAVYGKSVRDDAFSWDDELLITTNPHLNPATAQGLMWHWAHPHEFLYIPIVYTAWWCISAVAGMNPHWFHAANLLVHTGCCWLAYAILRMLVGRPWPALAGALLFALHPLQVEPVAWATGMKDLLCAFFSLAAIAFYIRPRLYWAAALCYVAAMLCKPSAVSLPLALAAIDFFVLRRRARETFWRLSPWLLASMAISLATSHLQPTVASIAGPIWARPLIAADALDWYLQKLFWPVNLAIDYGRRPPVVLSWRLFGIPWVAIAWIIPAAIAALLIYLRRPVLTAAALFFLFALLPVLGLKGFKFQTYSTVTDRYGDMALFAFAWAAAWLLAQSRRPGVFWLVLAILLALATASFIQTSYWADNVALYSRAIAVNPDSFLGHNDLGVALHQLGDETGAAEQFQETLRIGVKQPEVYNFIAEYNIAMGDQLARSGQMTAARRAYDFAITCLQRAAQLEPGNPAAQQRIIEVRQRLKGI